MELLSDATPDSVQDFERIRVARTAVINQDRRFLILTRSKNDDYNPGRADFPGGGLEPDETSYEQAAVREVREETGMMLGREALRAVLTSVKVVEDEKKIFERKFFMTFVEDPSIQLDAKEHSAYQWVTLSEARAMLADDTAGSGAKVECLDVIEAFLETSEFRLAA